VPFPDRRLMPAGSAASGIIVVPNRLDLWFNQ